MTKLNVTSNIIQEPILKEIHIECVFPKDMKDIHKQEFIDLVNNCIKDIGSALFNKNTILAIDTDIKTYTFKFAGLLVLGKENHYSYHFRFKYYK